MGTSRCSLGCASDVASSLKHKLNALQWRYTTSATWGLLSNNPSYKLSTWIWRPNIELCHLLWSLWGADTLHAMTPLQTTGFAVSAAPWVDWQHHALGQTNKTIGLLAGNVTQPVCQEQAQTRGEVRKERKFVSLWGRKLSNLNASPAKYTKSMQPHTYAYWAGWKISLSVENSNKTPNFSFSWRKNYTEGLLG